MKLKFRTKILSMFLTLCMVMTMLPMAGFAEGGIEESESNLGTSRVTDSAGQMDADMLELMEATSGTIDITQQPIASINVDYEYGSSPGTISVTAFATNGAEVKYQWVKIYSNMEIRNNGDNKSSFSIPMDVPGEYKYYCELTAEGCTPIDSEKTTVIINKASYSGIESDTVYVKANRETIDYVYTLPDLPASDMKYEVNGGGNSLISGTPTVQRDASTNWKWILKFNIASQPANTQEDIILTINGGILYKDSSFTLTVKTFDKIPVNITGVTGTNAEYSRNPHLGYTGELDTGKYNGELDYIYKGRDGTDYDSADAPIDSGDYTVTISIPVDADYEGLLNVDFSIKKKEIKVAPVNFFISQGQELPSINNIFVNYIGFVGEDNANNSISQWAVPKLNVSDSNTPGESPITFETEAALKADKERNYVLKHENGKITIQPKIISPKYKLTVVNGTGSGEYEEGEVVIIAANPAPEGKRFKEWNISEAVTYVDSTTKESPATRFTMPSKALTATAVYVDIVTPKPIYLVAFNANGGRVTPSSAETGTDGKLTSLPTPTRSNYSFDGWFTNASGGTKISTSYVFIENTTIYAHWTYIGGSNQGGNDDPKLTEPTTPTKPAAPSDITVEDNTAIVTISSDTITHSQMKEAIKKAQEAAEDIGKAPKVEINLETTKNAAAAEVTIPIEAIEDLVSYGISLTITNGLCSITFDTDSIKTIARESSRDVTISVAKADITELSDEIKGKIGNRPIYEFAVTSGKRTISQFSGIVTVAIPYTPAAYEDTNAIVIYHINDKGGLETIINGGYDDNTGTVIFETDHFSIYGVGYNKIYFKDVNSTAWYEKAVSYIAARDITSGITEDSFSTDGILTRGQFITMLLRAYGIPQEENSVDNFLDAGNTYYTAYLAAAKSLGITKGVGNNQFAPDNAITRQEMFTMLYNTLKIIDKLPKDSSGKSLADFTDSSSVSAYAQEAMSYLIKANIISGSSGKLSPTATTTRAQMVQVLYNLIGK